MLKKSIGMALLFMAGHAYSADITVTTTEDLVKDDEECSLREAVEYVNRGLSKEGYMGCGGENSSTNILLVEKKTYELNSHLLIKTSLSIKATSDTEGTLAEDERVLGLNNAHIKMLGKDNIFRIISPDDQAIMVKLRELDIEGCAQSQCADQGGLIYNKSVLEIDYSKLFKGHANLGGAIYNAGLFGTNTYSHFQLRNSLLERNKANQGGVIYSVVPYYSMSNIVVKANETVQNNSANIFTLPPELARLLQTASGMITSSTFLKNKGTVIQLVDGMGVNNVTVVDNTGYAVRANSPASAAFMANNILLANTAGDCNISAEDKSYIQNNLASASCGTGDAIYPNQIWSGSDIFASTTGSEGRCQNLAENKSAILCPYSVPEDTFLGYLRPRILLSYNQVEDSPIVNKGQSTISTTAIFSCEAQDQRMIARLIDNLYCDRGAIEITVPTSAGLIGQDISMGEVAKFSIANKLGDSDLLPKAQCKALVGDHPNGEPWQDGCLKIIQTKTESKGKTTIDIDGNVVYTPNSNWHGADIFEIQVVTSSTRFNKTKPYFALPTQIVQEPKDDFEDKTVKTSGGSWGFIGLFGLLGLIGLRRIFKY
jgi:rhombotarget A family protien